MNISVIGTGYVGLVTAACLSEIGNEILCIDIDHEKIKKLKNGHIPIYEPGLEEIVKRNIKSGRLKFSTQVKDLSFGDVAFIAVGTPPKESGRPDLSAVYQVAKSIGEHISRQTIIVDKSTVPVGTAREVETIIRAQTKKRRKNIQFSVVSNPEFLKEGSAVMDFMKPDRIVLGIKESWAKQKMKELYAAFVKNGHPIIVMNRESAEMAKYASNAMLACKISFMNQIANLCEIVGADVESVRHAMSLDQRIGEHFLYAGAGYGGSCFPKDVQALSSLAKDIQYPTPLLDAIEEVNIKQKLVLFQKIQKFFKNIEGRRFAIWGLSFKPNTDDTREAPSITIIDKILNSGGIVSAYDPKAMTEIKKIFGKKIQYGKEMYQICKGADALILITEWPEFREPDFNKMKKLLKNPIIFDGRNIYNPSLLKKKGFSYFGIGK